jgi:hypothetical protein
MNPLRQLARILDLPDAGEGGDRLYGFRIFRPTFSFRLHQSGGGSSYKQARWGIAVIKRYNECVAGGIWPPAYSTEEEYMRRNRRSAGSREGSVRGGKATQRKRREARNGR